jgi:hypothetical protein
VESLFMPWNIGALVDGFTPRLRGAFRYGAGVSRSGSLARLFHRAQREAERLPPQQKLPHLMSDTITNAREAEWQDAQSGGRHAAAHQRRCYMRRHDAILGKISTRTVAVGGRSLKDAPMLKSSAMCHKPDEVSVGQLIKDHESEPLERVRKS